MKKKKVKQQIPDMTIEEAYRKVIKEGSMSILIDHLDVGKRHHFVLIYQGLYKK